MLSETIKSILFVLVVCLTIFYLHKLYYKMFPTKMIPNINNDDGGVKWLPEY